MLRFGNITEIDVNKCYARVTFTDDGIVSDFLQIIVMGALTTKFFHIFDIGEQVACLMDENSDEGVILGAVYNNGTNPIEGNKDVVKVNFPDESVIEYDRATHEYKIDIKGKINITAETEVNVTAATANVTATTVAVDATAVSVDAESVSVEATNVNVTSVVNITGATGITGAVNVTGALTVSGVVTAGSVSTPSLSGGGVTVSGGVVTASGGISAASVSAASVSAASVSAGGIDLATHVHSGVTVGAFNSGPPV